MVTGHDPDGKAIVISDGPAPFVHVNAVNPEWYSTDIWRTRETPVRIATAAEEPTLGPRRQMPDKRGTVLRINDFLLQNEVVRQTIRKVSRRGLRGPRQRERLRPSARAGDDPATTKTETIDYVIGAGGRDDGMVVDDVDVVNPAPATSVVTSGGMNHA